VVVNNVPHAASSSPRSFLNKCGRFRDAVPQENCQLSVTVGIGPGKQKHRRSCGGGLRTLRTALSEVPGHHQNQPAHQARPAMDPNRPLSGS
jgi:hypothetical protein